MIKTELIRTTYFSPDDDCITALLDFIKSAQKSIRLADYSFNMPALAQILIDKMKSGVDVKVVLDKSQSKGKSEIPEVTMLQSANVPMVIGTSEDHKIMHLKCAVIDGEWTLSGSFNFTSTAEEEDNTFDIEKSVERATKFTDKWQRVWDFMQGEVK